LCFVLVVVSFVLLASIAFILFVYPCLFLVCPCRLRLLVVISVCFVICFFVTALFFVVLAVDTSLLVILLNMETRLLLISSLLFLLYLA
jgi:hypothetical protein